MPGQDARPSCDVGGSGSGAGRRGFCAASIGLNAIHPHRTAAAYALLSTAWHWRIDDAASGRQACVAPVVALMPPWGPVLDEWLARAASSAPTQLREEPLVRAWASFASAGRVWSPRAGTMNLSINRA